jgi:hypothetical protein
MMDVTDELGAARNTLLCAPSMTAGESAVCTDLLLPTEPSDVSVLWVSFRKDATACIDQWQGETDETPRNAAVIVVGESAEGGVDFDVTVESISNASDLTGLGIEIGQFLSQWDGELVVCFDSLTAMLQYVEVQTAYEFLHAITGQLYAADAYAHFHIDPTAHDSQTVDSIMSLFDAVVQFDDAGDPTVRTRELLQ